MKSGWQRNKLSELCEIVNGGTPKTGVPEYWRGSHLWITPAEMGNRLSPYVGDTDRKITDKGLRDSSAQLLPSNSVILSSRAPIGHLVINIGPMATNQGCKGLVPGRHIEHKFLYYYLSSIVDLLNSLGTGTTFKELSGSKLKEVKIPLPPLPEQQRIIAILDEAFADIATAKANAEKNLQNARALFESHLQSIFTQRGKGWVEKSLEEVCYKITDGTHHSPKTQFTERAPGRFPYITSKNIRNNFMDLSNVAYIEQAFHEEVYARCQPSMGDVLLTKDGANTGNVTLNTLDEPFSLLSSVCLIKTNQSRVKAAFLCYYLQSSAGLRSIVGQMTGAAIKRIVLKNIKTAVIPFPPLKEQDSTVEKLNSLLAETQRLAQIYERKLVVLEALKKSLLHQAFTGELTTAAA